jgi:hypothetical protein
MTSTADITTNSNAAILELNSSNSAGEMHIASPRASRPRICVLRARCRSRCHFDLLNSQGETTRRTAKAERMKRTFELVTAHMLLNQ